MKQKTFNTKLTAKERRSFKLWNGIRKLSGEKPFTLSEAISRAREEFLPKGKRGEELCASLINQYKEWEAKRIGEGEVSNVHVWILSQYHPHLFDASLFLVMANIFRVSIPAPTYVELSEGPIPTRLLFNKIHAVVLHDIMGEEEENG